MRRIIVRRPIRPWRAAPGDLHPVLQRVYAARGVSDAAELDYSLSGLCDVQALANIDAAVELLAGALCNDRRILIVGDFDADGATSCALAVRALRAMGAAHVDYLVPNRFEYGYGLTPEIVAVAAAQKQPDLIVTVDNGISSVRGVAAAHEYGIRVLITDHHLPGAELPAADAIVNPNQPGDTFPSKHLAGVGVIFYVMSALRAQVLARGERLELDDLLVDTETESEAANVGDGASPAGSGLQQFLESAAAERIRSVLDEVGGKRVEAARRLGIDRTTLYRLMRKYGLQ